MTSPAASGSKGGGGGGGGGGLFIPITGSSPHQRHGGRSSLSSYSSGGGGWPLGSSAGRTPTLSTSGGGGGGSGSRRRGSSSSSNFGGRGNDGAALLRGVKEVLNRIRWDLAETTGLPFEDVRVYLQVDPVTTTTTAAAASVDGGGGGEEVEEPSSRLCRQWVREGRCTGGRQRCKYSHALTLVGLGTRPSTKSAGSMAPLRVLQGYELEAAMGASSAAGTPSSFLSASQSAVPLHRAVFVEYGGMIVWDKEHPDTVWESFLASLEKPQPQLGGGSMGLPPLHPGSALMRRNSSADSLLLPPGVGRQGSDGGRPGSERSDNCNELLGALPHDVFLELTSHLGPGDCARCLRACWAWSERFGDAALWARFLLQRFNLPVTYTPDPVEPPIDVAMAGLEVQDEEEEDEEEEDRPRRRQGRWHFNVLADPPEHPRREYGQLAHVVRNAQALSDWNGGSSGGSGSGSISGSGSRATGSVRQQQQQPPPMAASTPTAASSSLLSSSPASDSGGRATTPASLASNNGNDAFSSSSPHLPPATPLSSRRMVTTHLHAVQRFHGHDRGAVIALHVDEAEDRLISGDVAGSVRLWELHSGARLATVDLRTHLTCLAADEWTIYAGTLKGALATVNREDMADVQAHKLGQSSNISALCLLPTASPAPRRRRHHSHHSTQQHIGRHSASSPLFPLSSSLVSPPPPQLRTPSPLLPHRNSSGGHKGWGTEEHMVRPRLVVGFGNGSFLLLHGTERLLLLQPGQTPPPLPSLSSSIGGSGGGGGRNASYWDGASGSSGGRLSSSASSSNSRGLLLPTVQHHLYALPVSHPACVFLAPTGPRSFVAAACPDRLFLWSFSSSSTAATTPGGSSFSASSFHEPGLLLQLPALSLTCAISPAGGVAEGHGELQRHSVEACCDVAVLAILPEETEEEDAEAEGSDDEEDDDESEEDVELDLDDLDVDNEDEDDDPLFPRGGGGGGSSSRRKKCQGRKTKQSRGRKGQKPALVVTACDHDAALRWWELTPGRNAAVCTAITPAPVSSAETGTLSLAQAKGVLLSAHLDGSLVVWHVGQRRPVARFGSFPLLESIALTPRALGLLACFERHILLARDVMAYGSAGGFVWGEEGGDDWEEALTENSGSCRRNNRRRGRRHSGAST